MFNGNLKESNQSEIVLQNIRYEIFVDFLKYLYTGKIEINSENAENLLQIADMYLVDDLKTLVEDYFCHHLDDENIEQIKKISEIYSSSRIEFYCKKFN